MDYVPQTITDLTLRGMPALFENFKNMFGVEKKNTVKYMCRYMPVLLIVTMHYFSEYNLHLSLNLL